MSYEPLIRRKWTFRAHDQQVVFVKGTQERTAHVIMKALLWALYLPQYPDMRVEVRIGDRYKPDVVQLDAAGHPVFWGEAGRVSRDKIHALVRRFRTTHFVIAKWDTRLEPLEHIVAGALAGTSRAAPFDLITFAPDSAERFIDERGHITVTPDDLTWVRLD